MFEGLSLEVGEGVGVRPIRESPIDEVGGGMVKKDRVIGAGEDPKHSMSGLPGKEMRQDGKEVKSVKFREIRECEN